MKPFLGVVMALVLLRAQGRKPNHGNCVDKYCITVHTDVADFTSAQKSCQQKGGHLMTVRTTGANNVISDLLTDHAGNFWIGLRYTKEICSELSHELKGYTWVTGDEATDFTNWKDHGTTACTRRCVSLSKEDLKWTDRGCENVTDGYLCEYENTNTCKRLESESAVLYETPFGFAREDLHEVPNISNATHQHLGTRYICSDGVWYKAPWNCEVYKGGCEHRCYKLNESFLCTCPPGYKLESNAVRCSKAHDDPCVRANCSQECVAAGEGHVCLCVPGYELDQDGKTCKHADNCDDKRLCPDENSFCVSAAGGFGCRCKDGFRMEKGACEDDDECFSSPCEHTCNNTAGSYHCECEEGFKVSSEDRHKCTLYCPTWECPAVACDINNPFQCTCPDGFILEERSSNYYVCIDINECDASYCDQGCTNTPGGSTCSCDNGFRLVGETRCVRVRGSSTVSTPTSMPPSVETASFSAGAILGIIVCTVMAILLTVCVVHHNMKRCGKITTDKSHSKDAHALQQVTAEKYVKKRSIPNVSYN